MKTNERCLEKLDEFLNQFSQNIEKIDNSRLQPDTTEGKSFELVSEVKPTALLTVIQEKESKYQNSTNNYSIKQIDGIKFCLIDIQSLDPLIGKDVFKRYRVNKKIGNGSFGEVYLVEDLQDKQKKALKKTDHDVTSENERKLLRNVRSENVVKFYDYFLIAPRTSSEGAFMCMITEYCEVLTLIFKY